MPVFFGETIRNARKALGLTQRQLSDCLGVSNTSVSNWENNNILPSVDMLKNIATFFHCSTDYLLEMNEGKIYIETTDLTLEQTAHLQQLVADLAYLNKAKAVQNK